MAKQQPVKPKSKPVLIPCACGCGKKFEQKGKRRFWDDKCKWRAWDRDNPRRKQVKTKG